MPDISTVWNADLQIGDWIMSGADDLQSGDDVVTAALISLFSDRLANVDDVIPDGTGDPRGWVGDLDQDVIIGSRLWLLSRSKLTQQVANGARDMATEALQWMVDDNVIASFTVTTEIVPLIQLSMQIVIYRQDGTKTALDFTNAWAGVN